MRISNVWLLLILVCSACSGSDKKKIEDPQDTSTFVVSPAVKGSVEAAKVDPNFPSLATARTLNFTACIKDVAAFNAVPGVPFAVKDGTKEIATLPTNADGCFTWSEPFPFDSTAGRTFFEVVRTIEAVDVHQGRQVLRIGVNPWATGAEGIKDLRFESVPKLSSAATPTAQTEMAQLVIEDVGAEYQISNTPSNPSSLLLNFAPKLRTLGLDGSPETNPLTEGKLHVRMQLVASAGNSIFALTDAVTLPEESFRAGQVRLTTPLPLLRSVPKEANLELLLKVEAIDSPAPIGPAGGRVSLGRLSGLTINQRAPLRAEAEISFLDTPVVNPLANAPPPAFGFGRVQLERAFVQELTSTRHPKKIEFHFFAKLINTATNQVIESAQGVNVNEEFQVFVNGEERPHTYEPGTGNRTWTYPINFDFFAQQDPIPLRILIKSKNDYYGNGQAERVIYVTPWQYENLSLSLYDDLHSGAPTISVAQQSGSADITITSVYMTTLGQEHHVDARMNMSTIVKFNVEATPEIHRTTNQGEQTIPLGQGHYIVKFSTETNDENLPKLIDAQSIAVKAENNKLSFPVHFRFPDPVQGMSRVRLYLQVVPAAQDVSLVTPVYYGQFDPTMNFMTRFTKTDLSPNYIDERIRQLANPAPPSPISNADLFAQAKGYERIEPKLREMGLSQETLDQAIDGTSKAALCDLFFDPKQPVPYTGNRFCRESSDRFLQFGTIDLIRRLKAEKETNNNPSQIRVEAGISYAIAESNEQTQGTSNNIGNEIGVKWGLPSWLAQLTGLDFSYGIKGQRNTYWSQSYSHRRSTTDSRGVDQGFMLTVDEVPFELEVDVDRCLVITAPAVPARSRKTYLGCRSQTVARSIRENFYLLNQAGNVSMAADPHGPPHQRPFVILVRGRTRFQTLRTLLQDPSVMFTFQTGLPRPLEFLNSFGVRDDGFFPGLLTPDN